MCAHTHTHIYLRCVFEGLDFDVKVFKGSRQRKSRRVKKTSKMRNMGRQ